MRSTVLGAAIAAAFSIQAGAHEASHSLEADQNDARLEGPQARKQAAERVTQIVGANGVPVDPATTYRVTVNSFIAAGGDNFLVLTEGANRIIGQTDLDALVEHVESLPQPFSVAIEGRILRAN